MKKLHLLCNAHIDPVWLWQRNEGLAETLSTFRVAADFCEEYDNFVFNHNEALLYEWVEEHDPELFARIQRLVKEKKWIIMGGWYLQPDCVMTSGESLLEQINLGREYFREKFGVEPKTAINFDPFGHTRGLVSILKNTGYDSYLFMRPNGKYEGDFLWEGFDGDKIKAHGIFASYTTLKGEALKRIEDYLGKTKAETGLCLWGIGNHGGGPSKIDLENINKFMKECDTEIVHSSADGYMAEVGTDNLKVVSESLIPCMVGCYTSMVRIKQGNRRLENKIALTEKALNYAGMIADFDFDSEELKKAKKALAFCQFHDILPGSAIRPVEEQSLKTQNYGEEIVDSLFAKAFIKLCDGQKKAKDGEIPILIFNPHPYEITGDFEIDFILQNQNWNEDEITISKVYDKNGNILLTQNLKEESSMNLDWAKKVVFTATLAPSSINRFNSKLIVVKKEEKNLNHNSEFIEVKNERMTARISRKTGLIEEYNVDGKTLLKNSGVIEVYNDYEDAWGTTVDSFKNLNDTFKLLSDREANEFTGYPEENVPNVRVVEDGEVLTKVQAFFRYNLSTAVVEYVIPKNDCYIDVNITLLSNEPNKMIKYRLNTGFNGTPWGQTAFGKEELYSNDNESVFHKWCGISGEDTNLYVINNGTHGGSFTENTIKLSLLRTPVYSGMVINERQIVPHDRCLNHIDIGVREFSFRITAADNVEREAQVFNESPYALSFFPSGRGEAHESVLTVDNPNVILSSVKRKGNKYVLTLYNTSDKAVKAKIALVGINKELNLDFKKFELRIQEVEI